VAATAGIKWPGPLPSKDDPRVARARGSKSLTLEGCGYQPVASKPAWREREPRTPSIYKDYRSAVRGPARLQTLESRRRKKLGAPSCHPAVALLIRGSEVDPRWVRNKRPRSTESGATRARAFEPILDPTGSGAPHMLYSRASEGSYSGDPIEGELLRPRSPANGTEPHLANPRKRFHGRVSGPRANPYRTGHGRPLESPDNSSTRNPQSATQSMGVVETSPSVPQRDDEGVFK
jgi:hypothetical protein